MTVFCFKLPYDIPKRHFCTSLITIAIWSSNDKLKMMLWQIVRCFVNRAASWCVTTFYRAVQTWCRGGWLGSRGGDRRRWLGHGCRCLSRCPTTSTSIIFVDHKRKQKVPGPVEISQLPRVKVINILGVTITNGLSVSPHVQSVIASCAQLSTSIIRFACPACPRFMR